MVFLKKRHTREPMEQKELGIHLFFKDGYITVRHTGIRPVQAGIIKDCHYNFNYIITQLSHFLHLFVHTRFNYQRCQTIELKVFLGSEFYVIPLVKYSFKSIFSVIYHN